MDEPHGGAALIPLYEGSVADEEIDDLGHMNVRFYLTKALSATRALASAHGLDEAALRKRGALLSVSDVFTRHYREQLPGARLAVRGGVLEVRGSGLRFYHELRGGDAEELSATFVHEVVLLDRATRRSLPLPELVAKSASGALVEWPKHGRPRSVDLDRLPADLGPAALRERGLATRQERVLAAAECDADGVFPADHYQDLVWGGLPVDGRPPGMPLFELPGGGRFGWATLESRGRLFELPRAGARIQAFGAEVALAPKTSFRHHWVYDLGRERLLCTSSIVNLAFDIRARRAIEIPPGIRATLEGQYHPELR